MNFYLFTSEFYSSKRQTIVVKNSQNYDKTNKLSKLMFISKEKRKKRRKIEDENYQDDWFPPEKFS